MIFYNKKRKEFSKSSSLKKVLIPVDGTKESSYAVKLASSFVKNTTGALLILNVIEVPLTLSLSSPLPEKEKYAEEIINKELQTAKQCGVKAEGKIEKSRSVKDGILKTSQANNADIIVFALNSEQDKIKNLLTNTIGFLIKRTSAKIIIGKSL